MLHSVTDVLPRSTLCYRVLQLCYPVAHCVTECYSCVTQDHTYCVTQEHVLCYRVLQLCYPGAHCILCPCMGSPSPEPL